MSSGPPGNVGPWFILHSPLTASKSQPDLALPQSPRKFSHAKLPAYLHSKLVSMLHIQAAPSRGEGVKCASTVVSGLRVRLVRSVRSVRSVLLGAGLVPVGLTGHSVRSDGTRGVDCTFGAFGWHPRG